MNKPESTNEPTPDATEPICANCKRVEWLGINHGYLTGVCLLLDMDPTYWTPLAPSVEKLDAPEPRCVKSPTLVGQGPPAFTYQIFQVDVDGDDRAKSGSYDSEGLAWADYRKPEPLGKQEDAATPTECKLPPRGWACSRGFGHEGPCSARPRPINTTSKDAMLERCAGELRAAQETIETLRDVGTEFMGRMNRAEAELSALREQLLQTRENLVIVRMDKYSDMSAAEAASHLYGLWQDALHKSNDCHPEARELKELREQLTEILEESLDSSPFMKLQAIRRALSLLKGEK